MAKYVIGSYSTVSEAKKEVKQLADEGYPTQSISVMADRSLVTDLGGLGVAVEDDYVYDGTDESTWDRIKDFFGRSSHEDNRTELYGHQQDLRDGKILVIVDCDAVPEKQAVSQQKNDAYWSAAQNTALNNPDDQTIQLMEERLNIGKESVDAGEVTLRKRVVQQTETIDVPVEHEELVIERTPVSGKVDRDAKFNDDTITIPLTEEQVRVTKEPVVTEEVHVKKREVTDTKHVSDTVRKEQLDVNKSGNVVVEGPSRGQNAPAP